MSSFRKALPRVLFFSLLATAQLARAGYGAGNPRLERLYGAFVAPCCWRENLTVHDSPAASEVRARIAAMVQTARSDDEIKSALIGEYGKRVLALPEGAQARWLFWTPLLVVAAGLLIVLRFVKHSAIKNDVPALAGVAPAELDDDWDSNYMVE